MAWRAGCRISNMEFMQFHPTCLYNLEVKNFLITEAVRGEGGQLKLPPGVKGGGKRFMPQFDERAELAPRDIVARAIDHEIKRLGLDYVHLDISHREPEFVRDAFPQHLREAARRSASTSPASRSRSCRRSITPAAAWSWTSTAAPTRRGSMPPAKSPSRGFTAPTAWPPTACSNAWCSARRRRGTSPPIGTILPEVPEIRAWDESRVTDSDEEVVIAQTWGEIRRFMWNYVGIVRTTKRLERAKHRIDMLRQEVTRLLRPLPRDARPDRASQPGRGRRPHHPLGAQPRTRAAGCTTRSIIRRCLPEAKDTVLVP